MLILLMEKSRTLDDFKEFFKITSPEILPQLKKLENGGLIFQKDRKYHLTEIGEILTNSYLEFFKTVKVFEDDMEFWESHQIKGIPGELRHRLSMLGDYKIIKSGPTEIFEPHKEFMANLLKSKTIKGISPIFHPEYPKAFIELAKVGVKISLIVTRDVYSRISIEFKDDLMEFLKYCEIMITDEKIQVATTVTERFFSLGLFLNNGVYDTHQDLVSFNKSSIQWGEDLFEYYHKKAKLIE